MIRACCKGITMLNRTDMHTFAETLIYVARELAEYGHAIKHAATNGHAMPDFKYSTYTLVAQEGVYNLLADDGMITPSTTPRYEVRWEDGEGEVLYSTHDLNRAWGAYRGVRDHLPGVKDLALHDLEFSETLIARQG